MAFVPSICFPFSSFPLRTFLSCPVFMFCYLILSFVCAHIGPGLSVYVHIYIHFQHRLQVAQVLTMRWGSSVVPAHLVSLSLQPHTHTHFCPVLSSLSCLHPFVPLASQGSFWNVSFFSRGHRPIVDTCANEAVSTAFKSVRISISVCACVNSCFRGSWPH